MIHKYSVLVVDSQQPQLIYYNSDRIAVLLMLKDRKDTVDFISFSSLFNSIAILVLVEFLLATGF
jgi:hypothetical protein